MEAVVKTQAVFLDRWLEGPSSCLGCSCYISIAELWIVPNIDNCKLELQAWLGTEYITYHYIVLLMYGLVVMSVDCKLRGADSHCTSLAEALC